LGVVFDSYAIERGVVMALWQFLIELIPKDWAEENGYNAGLLQDDDGYSTAIAWDGRNPEKDVAQILSKILPRADSYHKDLSIWGNTESNDVQMFHQDGEIEGISIRIDLNEDVKRMVIRVVRAAQTLDCIFFVPEKGSFAAANEFQLVRAIKDSDAVKFVDDPAAFMNSLDFD
jgi:hypothetical protein